MRLEWHAATDVGAVRKINEDRYFASEPLGLWAVADGMGGMARGDWASTQAVEAVGGVARQTSLEAMLHEAAGALRRANDAILAESHAQGTRMGTTAVVLVVRDNQFGVCWVGDSRAYLLRGRQMHKLTRDHSQVQEMVDHGIITPEQMERHPSRNVLTRAVGVQPDLAVDSIVDRLEPEDVVLLCSDGLHGVLDEREIRDILLRVPLSQVGQALIARCHEEGAPDNVTLVAVAAEEVTLIQFGEAGSAQ
ncbi:PP2C family protein-serine/threonine phosphatase [Novosphingobium bradum]|uniref:PP2C family protein-serine/threonine phosphatase n=1 Tax=Novosphingobium bradum TaxID=1737444 RepID=A0ABV7ISK9_9SPHN